MPHPVLVDGEWDLAWCCQWRLSLDNLLFLLPQYVTHPAEQSVLIHILWANVNFNSSGEFWCALVLRSPIPAWLGEVCWRAQPRVCGQRGLRL